MVSVGAVIAGGFRLFREQRVALLIWMAVALALSASTSLFFIAGVNPRMEGLRTGARSSFEMIGWLLPFYALTAIVVLLQTAAAFRAVMRPNERAAGFFRLGMDELRLLGLGFVWLVVALILYFLLVMVAFSVAAMLAGALGPPGPGILFTLAIILLPIYGLMIYLHVRLSPAIPLTLLRRQIVIGEAWRLTKGQFWPLFAAYLVIMLMLIVGYLLLLAVIWGPYLGTLVSGASGVAAAAAQVQVFGPMMVVGWVAGAAFSAASYALWAGSVGTATLELLGTNRPDYAATFE